MYFVEVEEPVKCPKCGFFATLYVNADKMTSIYRCARHHETKSKTNKKEKALAIKQLEKEVPRHQLLVLAANFRVSNYMKDDE